MQSTCDCQDGPGGQGGRHENHGQMGGRCVAPGCAGRSLAATRTANLRSGPSASRSGTWRYGRSPGRSGQRDGKCPRSGSIEQIRARRRVEAAPDRSPEPVRAAESRLCRTGSQWGGGRSRRPDCHRHLRSITRKGAASGLSDTGARRNRGARS